MKLLTCTVVLFVVLFVGLPAKKANLASPPKDPMFFCKKETSTLCRKNINFAAYFYRLHPDKLTELCPLLEDCEEVRAKCTNVPREVTRELCSLISKTTKPPTTTAVPCATFTPSPLNVPIVPSSVSERCLKRLKKYSLAFAFEKKCRTRVLGNDDHTCEFINHKKVFAAIVSDVKKACTPRDVHFFVASCEDYTTFQNCSGVISIQYGVDF